MSIEVIGWRLFGSLIWVSAILLILVKTHQSARAVYRVQAIGEAGLMAALAFGGLSLLWFDVALIVVVKVLVVPRIMQGPSQAVSHDYGSRGPVGLTAVLLVSLLFTVGGVWVGQMAGMHHPLVLGLLLGAWFVSFFHLSSRYETWSLGWALLSLDTVTGGLVVAAAGPVPESLEIGMNVAAIATAVLLALLARKISSTMHTVDVRDVEELTG